MKQKREGGSVPGFIVAAIILVGLLMGGAYFVQQQGKNKQSNPPISAEQPKEGEQKPAEETATSPPATNTPQPTPNNSTTQPSPASHLPQSGPADTLVTILMLGILAGAVISFLQSRRHLAPL